MHPIEPLEKAERHMAAYRDRLAQAGALTDPDMVAHLLGARLALRVALAYFGASDPPPSLPGTCRALVLAQAEVGVEAIRQALRQLDEVWEETRNLLGLQREAGGKDVKS